MGFQIPVVTQPLLRVDLRIIYAMARVSMKQQGRLFQVNTKSNISRPEFGP